MSSLLPTPEPPDPVEGALGHFDHTNWVKASLKALDQGTARKTGGLFTGEITIDDPNGFSQVSLKGGVRRAVVGLSAQGQYRWRLSLGNETVESGANSGSRFTLASYSDDGATQLHTALDADRGTGLVKVVGAPVEANGIATKGYVDSAIPVGTIIMFGGTSLPVNMQAAWQVCDGSATVPGSALANLVGANVPDLRGMFVVGAGQNADPTTGSVTNYPVGKGSKLGKESVALTQAQTPVKAHFHSIDHDHGAKTSGPGSNHGHTINHDHGQINTGNNTHNHTLSIREGTGEGDGYYLDTNPTDSGAVKTLSGSKTSDYTHAHTVNLPSFAGSSGGESAHTHSVSVPAHNGNSGLASDASASGHENRPPYYALIYIIKKV